MRFFETVVSDDDAGLMVKQLLGSLTLGRKLRRMMLAQGSIRLNGLPVFLTARVRAGDVLTVDAVDEVSEFVIPEDIALEVAWEDEHVLVVDKPAGTVVHPTGAYHTGTLVAAVAHYMQTQGERFRIRPLHRLDRDTSGLILFAKHKLAHERLVRALEKRKVQREYVAFAYGIVTPAKQTIDAPICLLAGSAIIRTVAPEGKRAVTHVRTLETYPAHDVSKVGLTLETGRTHQIRVHMQHIGHPLLGDTLYGGEGMDSTDTTCARQALHAARLSFPHPLTERHVTVAAHCPADMQALESALRA